MALPSLASEAQTGVRGGNARNLVATLLAIILLGALAFLVIVVRLGL